MKTMVITGGNGFIASLVKEAMQSTMEIIPLTRKELDLGETAAVRSWFNTHDTIMFFIPELWHRQRTVKIIRS